MHVKFAEFTRNSQKSSISFNYYAKFAHFDTSLETGVV